MLDDLDLNGAVTGLEHAGSFMNLPEMCLKKVIHKNP
jgi:hypothetical protein